MRFGFPFRCGFLIIIATVCLFTHSFNFQTFLILFINPSNANRVNNIICGLPCQLFVIFNLPNNNRQRFFLNTSFCTLIQCIFYLHNNDGKLNFFFRNTFIRYLSTEHDHDLVLNGNTHSLEIAVCRHK